MPAHIAEIANLCADRRQEHEYPLVNRINKDDKLTLGVFQDRLAYPCRRAFFFMLVDDRAKRRVDVVAQSPLACQAVKPFRQWLRARIEIEMELSIEASIKIGWCEPVVLAVLAVAGVKLVGRRRELRLVGHVLIQLAITATFGAYRRLLGRLLRRVTCAM